MDKLTIKNKNGNPLIFFDSEYGKKLDTYSKVGFYHFNFENESNGVSTSLFSDYLINIFASIKITKSTIKNSIYDFSNELNSFIFKFNSIGFDINSIIKDHGYEDDYFINRSNIIMKYYKKCIDKLDGKSLTALVELVNKFYVFQVKVFKSNDLFILKDDLMNNLKDVCSLEEYNYYNNLYDSLLKDDTLNIKELENLFLKIQSIILDDWKKRISSVDDYKVGSPFKFICHSTNSKHWNGDFLSKFISASLLTENHTYTYNQPYGFILDPNDIVMTSCDDLFIMNNSNSIENICNSGVLPTVKSFDYVDKNTIYYNEVVLDKFNPRGIFCITDGSKYLNQNYLNALELQKSFPNLSILDFDISFFIDHFDYVVARNGLVDAIEEDLEIYSDAHEGYYDYFSYFWDDFMLLKKSDYTTEDIINLFKKHYNLIYMDIDELLSSGYDDTFILKIIGANSTYNSINKISNNLFDINDIKKFYSVYSKLSDVSYIKISKLFPFFDNFYDLLDEFLAINNYDLDCLDKLKNYNTYDSLISFFYEFINTFGEFDNDAFQSKKTI